jgi:energy-coupling factor transport system substrate-specific component
LANLLGWVQGLNGLVLALAIAGLLFVEEVGVPLPLAPGDVLLAIGGIAIAAGKIPALEFIAIAMAAILTGAILGREIFALLGWERLLRLARTVRVQGPVERVSALLHQQGWRAVFTARLIPGLRVHTTQVAGVTEVPRRTFIAGLVPAAIVYVAAFTGLGAAFGGPILAIIGRAEQQFLTVGLPIIAAVVVVLILRRPVQSAIASVGPAGWANAWVLRLESPGFIVIPACIGINFTGHLLATELHLPLFLDTPGTILSALIAGPWVGASVGVITNIVSANSIDQIAGPYAAVSFAIGFAAGLAARQGWHRQPAGWLALWAICFLLSAVISTPLNLLISDGHSGVAWGDAIVDRLAKTIPLPVASLVGEAAIDLPDKLIAVALAVLIYRALPQPVAPARRLELDLATAFRFVFRSERWLRKLLIGSLALLFIWLVVPFFLLYGYFIEVARQGTRGQPQLPEWTGLRQKLKDGFLMSLVFVVWNAPPGIVSALPQPASTLGDLLGVLVGLIQPAIWSQYLMGGFRGTFDVLAIARRVRFNLNLTLVVGALGLAVPTLGFLGVIAFVVGVLPAIVYTSAVVAYLFGQYATITNEEPELVPA